MLEGIRSNPIIAGAYTDANGICPMLAAHRAGGRTDCIAFARAWDRFTLGSSKRRLARRATPRELLILRTHLEASLLNDDGSAPDLAAAVAAHRALIERRAPDERPERPRRERPRPGDPDRGRELRERHGWAWMRVVRRYDDYERALALLESERERVAS
jgi:hypothetical protein